MRIVRDRVPVINENNVGRKKHTSSDFHMIGNVTTLVDSSAFSNASSAPNIGMFSYSHIVTYDNVSVKANERPNCDARPKFYAWMKFRERINVSFR
jgi:hypothetical protein